MDLRQLRYVVAVAQTGGFTRAAESVHVAQPALSLAVRQLEIELGVRLFDRTSRRVTATDAGVAFVARGSRILNEIDGVVEEMTEFSGGIRGTVRAATHYHFDPDLPELLRDFVVANPGVRFSIVEIPTTVAIEELRAGSLDFGVFGMTPSTDISGLETITIREEPLVLAVRLDHPLARDRSIPISRLAEVPLIMGPQDLTLRRTVDGMLANAGVTPDIILETRSPEVGVAYASLGIGGAILMRATIEDVGRPVSIVEIEGAPLYRVGVFWNPTAYRRPAAALVLAYIQSAAERRGLSAPRHNEEAM